MVLAAFTVAASLLIKASSFMLSRKSFENAVAGVIVVSPSANLFVVFYCASQPVITAIMRVTKICKYLLDSKVYIKK